MVPWPESIQYIIEQYFIKQVQNGGQLKQIEKRYLVSLLINEYSKLAMNERKDLLIPADSDFLLDDAIGKEVHPGGTIHYYFRYLWPQNSFASERDIINLEVGNLYDRIGPSSGTYLSPVKENGEVEPFLSRAIPYYIPEIDIRRSPAYHTYRIQNRYVSTTSNPVYQGITAPAFWKSPPDGGAVQMVLPKPIIEMGGFLVEQT